MLFCESFLPGAIFGSNPRLHQALCHCWDNLMYYDMVQFIQIALHQQQQPDSSRTHTDSLLHSNVTH